MYLVNNDLLVSTPVLGLTLGQWYATSNNFNKNFKMHLNNFFLLFIAQFILCVQC